MNSGTRILSCTEVNGGYEEFVQKFKKDMQSMKMKECTETNKMGLKTNIVMCPDPSNNGNMISATWFQNKENCEASLLKKKQSNSKNN